MFTQLWNDESGAILTVELVLIATIVAIGAVAGLTTLRNAIVTELSDLAQGVSLLDQSYEVPWIRGPAAWSAGTRFIDLPDPGDANGALCIRAAS